MMAANRFQSGLTKPAVTGQSSMMSTVMVTMSTCNQKEKFQPHMSIVEDKTVEFSGDYQTSHIFFAYAMEHKFNQSLPQITSIL